MVIFMKKILLVEDNEVITKGLLFLLSKNYEVTSCTTYEDASNYINNLFDLIILDINLPDGSGFDLASKTNIPILFLTARDLEEDIIKGLSLGEDYLIKPFRNQELLARIEKILKRNNKSILSFESISINLDNMEVYEDNKVINLTKLEFKILVLLLENLNKIITRDKLYDLVYDNTSKFVESNTLSVYIKRLREKFSLDFIETIKGVGYRVNKK